MGKPKQLLSWNGMPLVNHIIQTAAQAGTGPVLVILGAHAEKIRPVLKKTPAIAVINNNWDSGPGSSIATGISYIMQALPQAKAAIIALCDQPLLTASHLQQIASVYRQQTSGVVASEYNQISGVPALFDRQLFPALLNLPPAAGAQKIIAAANPVVTIPFPQGAYDIDTPNDLETVRKITAK